MICGVIIIKYFKYDNISVPREIVMRNVNGKLYHTLVNLKGLDKEKLERPSNFFAKQYIHGLTLRPRYREENIPYEEYKAFIQSTYNKMKTNSHYILAYKGKQIEKKVLEELKIPSLDLEEEEEKCPNVEILVNMYGKDTLVETCGHHTNIKSDRIVYCPLYEVKLLLRWIKENV
jgi:hypothetical protein